MYKTLTWLTLKENTSLKIKTLCFRLTGMCGSGYSDDCLGREQVCSCLSPYGIDVLFSSSLLVLLSTSCPRYLLCIFLRTGYQIFQAVPFIPIQFPWLSLPDMYTSTTLHIISTSSPNGIVHLGSLLLINHFSYSTKCNKNLPSFLCLYLPWYVHSSCSFLYELISMIASVL